MLAVSHTHVQDVEKGHIKLNVSSLALGFDTKETVDSWKTVLKFKPGPHMFLHCLYLHKKQNLLHYETN